MTDSRCSKVWFEWL